LLLKKAAMNQLQPYINFNGRCKEAMLFYKSCLGGELQMQKISESPMAIQIPSAKDGQILHAVLVKEHLQLFGSDISNENFLQGNNIQLSLNCETMQELETAFQSLQQGGKEIIGLHQTFWGSHYGELMDKFGIYWLLHHSKTGS
jgi:PhnB protein